MIPRVLPTSGVLLVTGALLLALMPSSVAACSCSQTSPPAVELGLAAAVFTGVVQKVSRDAAESVVTLQVTGSWKGVSKAQKTVRTKADPEACGFSFEVGSSYLVYAYSRGPDTTTTSCTRSGRMSDVGADLSALGPAAAPPQD